MSTASCAHINGIITFTEMDAQATTRIVERSVVSNNAMEPNFLDMVEGF